MSIVKFWLPEVLTKYTNDTEKKILYKHQTWTAPLKFVVVLSVLHSYV